MYNKKAAVLLAHLFAPVILCHAQGRFTPTEHWAAFVNKDNFGLGVVNSETSDFIAGFSGAKGSGGPHDSPTGYIAPIKSVQLGADEDYTFTSHLVLGDISSIRAYAIKVAKQVGLLDSNMDPSLKTGRSADSQSLPEHPRNHMCNDGDADARPCPS